MHLNAEVLDGLDGLDPRSWQALARAGTADTSVFLTPQWQKSWWEAFGRGHLLPVLVSNRSEPVLLATMFLDHGMAFFVGAGGSDYLDLVGDSTDADAVRLVLGTVLKAAPQLVGFRLHHVPDWSPTATTLSIVANDLGLDLVDEGSLGAPYLGMAEDPQAAQAATSKRSLVRHERWFQREGDLRIEHLRTPSAILPHLEGFFAQHVDRWEAAGVRSPFTDPAQREFFRAVATRGGEAGWVRFTRVLWNDRPIAFHFGFSFRRGFLWYKPSFAIDLAKRSPGEVLMRALLLEALDEHCSIFDLGLGEEPFKARFSNGVRTVRTWGLYPNGAQG